MDTHLTAPFKQQLLDRRYALMEQLEELRGGKVGRAQASAEHFGQSEDSTAQVATARDLELALDAREVAELAAIDAALERVKRGHYGQCTDCQAAIPGPRLHAAPETARCMECQTRSEAA